LVASVAAVALRKEKQNKKTKQRPLGSLVPTAATAAPLGHTSDRPKLGGADNVFTQRKKINDNNNNRSYLESSTMPPSSRHSQNLGQIIEYIPDRLYLAAYINPPTSETLFPYPESPVAARKRSQRTVESASASKRPSPCYFTVDDTLLYNAFHHDFGPLHIGHLYRFAIQFHDILGAKENKDRPIVFWSAADPRSE
jgi:hypothetical protein